MLTCTRVAALIAFAYALTGCRAVEERKLPEKPPGESTPATELEKQIFDAVNRERSQRNLDPVAWDEELLAPAREHSRRMAELGYFSHEDPERGSLPERLKRFRVGYTAAGENLFVMSGIPNVARQAVEGWLQSPGHRDVMLKPEFQRSAVGLYRTREGVVYGTQIFTRSGWLGSR